MKNIERAIEFLGREIGREFDEEDVRKIIMKKLEAHDPINVEYEDGYDFENETGISYERHSIELGRFETLYGVVTFDVEITVTSDGGVSWYGFEDIEFLG